MILLASTCISKIFETLVRLCKCAYRFEYNPARNPSDMYVHDQATETSIRKSATRNFLLQSKSFGGGGIHPQSLWGAGAVALASQLRCLKLSLQSFNKMYSAGVITSLMATGAASSSGAVTCMAT